MNHYTWTYVAGEGRNTKVGVYHSSRTGHLLIYVGKKIVTIDFKVFQSKEYSFFIDSELCRIKLDRRGDEMYYFFEIDKKADTPMNRARWAMERKFLRQMLIALGIFAIVITGFTIWMQTKDKPAVAQANELLAQKGVETVGKVTIQPGQEIPEISYHFVAQNQGYSSKPTLKSEPLVLLRNGMPLESGDEFTVRYIPSNPSVNKIDFNRPTEKQILAYQNRALQRYLDTNPQESPQIAKCKVAIAYELEGIGGLADFYFQNTPEDDNPDHNENSYLRLVRSLPFQKKVEQECWQ